MKSLAGRQSPQGRSSSCTLGCKIDNINIQIAERDLQSAIKEAGTTNITLDVDGTTHEVLLREVIRTTNQQHFIHVEFTPRHGSCS